MAKKHSLNLEFNEEAYGILEELSSSLGKSKAETLRQALILRHFVEKQKQEGNALGIIRDNRVEKEIILGYWG